MKSKSVFFLLLFSVITLSAQTKIIDSSYVKYFQYEREIPYLHLNKTSFAKGEEIWFKAYILNTNTQKLHSRTTNLHCSIYDEKGVFKKTALVYIREGVGNGSFKVDSTFTTKNYYIKASTNYMKNFEEDQSFIQKIKIIDQVSNKKITETKKDNFDLQVLPEGGHLLANTLNTIGVILKDKKGIAVGFQKGQVVEGNGKVIKEFELNKFGMSKVQVFVEPSKKYAIQILPNSNEKIETFFPEKELEGVALTFENISSNMTKITVKTNKETITSLLGKKYYVLIHNTNSFLKREIEFKKDLLTYTLFLNKKLFKPGTNILTLFSDEDKPIAERVFFNYQKSLFDTVDINLEEKNDSLFFSVGKQNNKAEYRLSASILPEKTKSYNPSHSIYSKFLIAPFIKGDFSGASYFFQGINRKKLWELDLLFLTQGWSKYNWYNIFKNPPIERFPFEAGIKVKGSLNIAKAQDSTDVFIRSDVNKLFVNVKAKDNKFEFKNLKLRNGSPIFISYANEKGELTSPNLYVKSYPNINKEDIKIPVKSSLKFNNTEEKEVKVFLTETEEVLKEVEVRGKIKFDHKPLIGGKLKGYKVSEDYSEHYDLLSFLRYAGLEVRSNINSLQIRRNRERAFNFSPVQTEILFSKTRIFLDNQEITRDTPRLLNLRFSRLGEYEEIYITDIFDLQIFLYTKDQAEFIDNSNTFYKYKIPLGFHVQKEYYKPKYTATNSDTFKKYGAIHWEPNIALDTIKKEYTFAFPHLNQKDIRVYIEGISKEGKLISLEKVININQKNN
ncbi:hypothetical protein [Tenacibaculum jejuense]|uniref:TonB-dependent outer membrane receptor n=1 Tax=Tenacibaculum jejuense TaxID=584609 RepID=A0A238UFJ1_9FLAO|nr:hypothetical protein [Tenacibaculum jejuense]SNR17224.1 Protein of unknown function precursor [Tenacibaculum jejuense]